jgi:hypothetical protein
MKLINELNSYLDITFPKYYSRKIEMIENINLYDLLTNQDIYYQSIQKTLFAQDLVKNILDAYLQSQEETLFGDFLEGVAIFVCQKVFGGIKSRVLEGIDLEFTKNKIYYIIEIKSGPNWGNSSQIKRMKDNFKNAKSILLKHNANLDIIAVNGCCYGIENQPNKSDYLKVCGQEFWELISGSNTLYIDIIEPLGYEAKNKNEEFLRAYAKVINKFTLKFTQEFCKNGEINWKSIVEFNSRKKLK